MKTAVIAAISTLALLAASGASARGFAKRHPRRAEVNQRFRNQRKRIDQGVKNGTMSKKEARADRMQLRQDKAKERRDVKQNGGYLTKGEQHNLNKNLNGSSKGIYGQKHDGAGQ